MVVLVTGGSGLVGNAIRKVVEDDSSFIFVSSSDADLTSWDDCLRLFQEKKPSRVIHLAARVGGLYANACNQVGFFETNLQMNLNVVRACHACQVMHAVFCLSTCVFPAEADLPLSETALHAGPPHESNEGYAQSKRMLECHVRFYRKEFNYNWKCIIPTNIYGPFDNFRLEEAHVIPALIHKCWRAFKEGTHFEVRGTGNGLRQFIYADDLARIILTVLESDICDNLICSDDLRTETTIGDVAKMIADLFGLSDKIKFDQTQSDGIHKKTASNLKLRNIIGKEFVFTSIEKGIKETVSWFLENVTTKSIRL